MTALAATNQPWTAEEDRILIDAFNSGAAYAQLCERLPQRSRRGIEYRITMLRTGGEIDGAMVSPSGHPASDADLDEANRKHVAALLRYYVRNGHITQAAA